MMQLKTVKERLKVQDWSRVPWSFGPYLRYQNQDTRNGSLDEVIEALDMTIQRINRHLEPQLAHHRDQDSRVPADRVPRDAGPGHLHLG